MVAKRTLTDKELEAKLASDKVVDAIAEDVGLDLGPPKEIGGTHTGNLLGLFGDDYDLLHPRG